MNSISHGRNSIGGLDAENARALLQDEIWDKPFNMSGEIKETEDLNDYASNNYWRNEAGYKAEDLFFDYS